MIKSILFILGFLLALEAKNRNRHLVDNQGLRVNCEKNRFELDGQPFQYISGEIHYFRIPRQLWNDRLYRLRAMGLNVIQVYVAWNWHEMTEGDYNFNGDRDLVAFLRLAQKHDLYVREMGGLPAWLLSYDNISLRDNKGPFLDLAKRFLKRLVDEVKDLQYPDGPIIMAQVENEYGSYGSNHDYMNALASALKEYGMNKALLYTTDGPSQAKNGKAEGAYSTVDFGVCDKASVERNFAKQREVEKCGPYVNSEFYTGWFDGWQNKKAGYPSSDDLIKTLGYIFNDHNASVSLYMAHGGTNFEFWEGGETDSTIITSYDYGSPLTESGQITDKYLAIRRFIKQIPWWKNRPISPVPTNHTAFEMSEVQATRIDRSLPELFLSLKQNCKTVNEPENFEKFNQSYGYAIYKHEFNGATPKQLNIEFLRDLAYVFVGDTYQGVLGDCNINRCLKQNLTLDTSSKGPLYIIVENLGRLNFNHGLDYKGIRSSVKADGQKLTNWVECGVDVGALPKFVASLIANGENVFAPPGSSLAPGIYVSAFKLDLPDNGTDIGAFTYFDPLNWGKGQFFLNNYNVGRYWPSAGPQRSIFVPGVFFKNKGLNRAILINFEPQKPAGTLSFVKDLTWKNTASLRKAPMNRGEML
ncbi:Glycoside hydrolase domain containing protein [Aphelenchoides bicaudatus]|nr:Glycoside hydrolase domain containing protein [Aphelenchoides bicaudatus]